MKRPMSDAEYVAGDGGSCPFCGRGELEAMEHPQAEGRDCWQEVECRDCHKTWREIYRLAGYESTDAADNGQKLEDLPQKPETGIYLVFVEGDIEPRMVGPFADGDERDKQARTLRREHGRDHGIYKLDVKPLSGTPTIQAYGGAFFSKEDEP